MDQPLLANHSPSSPRDQQPKDTEEELFGRFAVAVRGDAMFRAISKDTFGDWLRELEPQRKRKDN